MPHSSIQEVLVAVKDCIDTARLGYEDFVKGQTPTRRAAGLRNAIVWGRNITQTLHLLRSFNEGGYNEWYRPWQEQLRSNPDFQYIYDLRNQVLKQGFLGRTSTATYIGHLNTSDIGRLPRPKNATSFFIGDRLGGSGWEIALESGEKDKFYIDVPSEWGVTATMAFVEPTTEKKIPPPDRDIGDLLDDYLSFLQKMATSARDTLVKGAGEEAI